MICDYAIAMMNSFERFLKYIATIAKVVLTLKSKTNNLYVCVCGIIKWFISLPSSLALSERNDNAHERTICHSSPIDMFCEWVIHTASDLYLCEYEEDESNGSREPCNLRKVGFLAWKASREIEYDTDPDETRIHKRDCNETSARNARNFSLMIALVDGASGTRALLRPAENESELIINKYNSFRLLWHNKCGCNWFN